MNIKQPNPRIICTDGVSLSVQASSYHYCSPRIDELDHWTDYSSVEVGFIKNANDEDFTPPDDWKAYAEDGFPSDVYSFVPTQMVKEFIEKHGGTVI